MSPAQARFAHVRAPSSSSGPAASLSRAQARRIALAAQGFLDPPHAAPTMRTFTRTLERTGVLQVDSVNVLQRAHYMPLYSRMGPYDVDLVRRASETRPRRMASSVSPRRWAGSSFSRLPPSAFLIRSGRSPVTSSMV